MKRSRKKRSPPRPVVRSARRRRRSPGVKTWFARLTRWIPLPWRWIPSLGRRIRRRGRWIPRFRTWPSRLKTWFVELRRDSRFARSTKVRGGFGLAALALILANTGFPSFPNPAWTSAFIPVFAAVPAFALGVGVALRELARARIERRLRARADAREIESIRVAASGAVTQLRNPGPKSR